MVHFIATLGALIGGYLLAFSVQYSSLTDWLGYVLVGIVVAVMYNLLLGGVEDAVVESISHVPDE
jgi:ABC-type multidrug transport system permease subunit